MKCVALEIELSRTVKPADYESKVGRARLAFIPDVEEDGIQDPAAELTYAFNLAQAEVCRRMGLKFTEYPVGMKVVKHEHPEDEGATAETLAKAAKKTMTSETLEATAPLPKVKDRKPGRPVGSTSNKAAAAKKRQAVAERKKAEAAQDAAMIPDEEDDGLDMPATGVAAAVANQGTPAKEEFEDRDLLKQVTLKVKSMKADGIVDAPVQIKAIIAAFKPEDHTGVFNLASIELKDHEDFEAQLKELG